VLLQVQLTSECGRFYVDPEVYYGAVYVEWRARKEGKR